VTIITEFVAGRTPPELYERYLAPAIFLPLAHELIKRIEPAGDVLDVACGTGALSRVLARSSGVERIAGVDVAPDMVDLAQEFAEDGGYASRSDIRVASAEDLPFPDGAFDVCLCQQGLQFFPNRSVALSEARRVIKPGGTFGAAVWTRASDGNPIFEAYEKVVGQQVGSDLVPLGPFSFGDGDELSRVVRDAGLSDVEIVRHSFETTLPNARTLVLFDLLFLGRPAADGSMQPIIDPDDPSADAIVTKIIKDVETATESFRQPDGRLQAQMTTNIVFAQK